MDVARRIKPLKIILTVTNDLSYDQRMQRICTSLASAGYAVELVGRKLKSSLPFDKYPFSQVRLNCWFTKGKVFYLEYNVRLFFYLLFQRADIICAVDLDTIVPGYYAAKIKGAKIVYDAHELFPEVPEVIRRPEIQKVWQWVERTYTPKMDLVYTVTQSIADKMGKEYGRSVFTIRNLPILEETPTSNEVERHYLLYQGALNEGRGLEQLIEAMVDIDMELYLVGSGDIELQLKAQSERLGLQQKIKFIGLKKPVELKLITAKAYIGLNLLENKGLSYYYSLANKFSDYIHAGIPQVCIDFPEYSRINEQYNIALLIENLEKESIKAAIRRLVNDKKMYDKLKENCLVCRQELNWQNEAKKLISLYERLH
jgi:glycosyltransferase involved in cell wall biosynthesis